MTAMTAMAAPTHPVFKFSFRRASASAVDNHLGDGYTLLFWAMPSLVVGTLVTQQH